MTELLRVCFDCGHDEKLHDKNGCMACFFYPHFEQENEARLCDCKQFR